MELGNKIFSLRKSSGFSQEQLAEKLNVTRQTVSNWELEQTTPDILQAKQLAKIFNISLDELVENNIKDVLIAKFNNTEKSISTIIKILKFFSLIIICFLLILIVTIISLSILNMNKNIEKSYLPELTIEKFYCTLDNQTYGYQIPYDQNYKVWSPVVWHMSGDAENVDLNFIDILAYEDARQLISDIKKYFEENGGTWQQIK